MKRQCSEILVAPSDKTSLHQEEDSDNDAEFENFLTGSIAKRNIKAGIAVVKKAKKNPIKGEIGGGSFQSMGLNSSLLRSLTLQGYRIPTPIQRLAIPILLANPIRDLVGMARTGSGKTLAYMIPLVQRLGGRHLNTFGARALILIPNRELAVQILKVGKELARGWLSGNRDHAGDRGDDLEKGRNLRWGLIVGGESMDEQFEMIANNPDIIIATPGRLLHLIVEMNLDLKSVQHVIFDEADRLFEMGFETALSEIIHRLPPSRQTLLFSATLPKSLVEFARAGLHEPKLVRLDAESKLSPDLKMAFFSVKEAEKEACLLALLRDVIKVPVGSTRQEDHPNESKRSGKAIRIEQYTAPHQTLIFVATKHHVEFVANLLITAGYAVSHIYGSLDQTARTFQMDRFRHGITSILVVTDVAARGIDIPILENVVNYDFPQGSRVFVHRVGRTARAGRQGWAWSFVSNTELPYLLDLQLSLGRPLINQVSGGSDQPFTDTLVLGNFERRKLDEDVEYIRTLEESNHSLPTLRGVMKRGHALYERSKGKASSQSYKRAKDMMKDPKWSLTAYTSSLHPVLLREAGAKEEGSKEEGRQALLRSVISFKPSETIFEIGTKGSAISAALMKQRRKVLNQSAERALISASTPTQLEREEPHTSYTDHDMANEDDIVAVFDTSVKQQGYRDSEYYMAHYQQGAAADKGYSLTDNATFSQQAQRATFDLVGDESAFSRQKRQLNWDKKKKRFVKGDRTGADNVKLVTTESGTKLPATYRSGRFDEWKAKTRVSLPKVGEAENESSGGKAGVSRSKRFRHHSVVSAKPLDKLHKDYERKVRQTRKMADDARGLPLPAERPSKPSRFGKKTIGRVKTELKTVEQIRKARKVVEKKKAKNARPSRAKKGHR